MHGMGREASAPGVLPGTAARGYLATAGVAGESGQLAL